MYDFNNAGEHQRKGKRAMINNSITVVRGHQPQGVDRDARPYVFPLTAGFYERRNTK
jgi:hypothetical protein